MISEAAISKQLVRLSALRNQPETPEEARKAYRVSAKNEAHAGRMTAWWMEQSPFFPAPADIFEAARQTLEPDDMVQPDTECVNCGGSGYMQAWMLETRGEAKETTTRRRISADDAMRLLREADGWTQTVYPCSTPCEHCDYGRAIKAPRKDPDRDSGLQKVKMPPSLLH